MVVLTRGWVCLRLFSVAVLFIYNTELLIGGWGLEVGDWTGASRLYGNWRVGLVQLPWTLAQALDFGRNSCFANGDSRVFCLFNLIMCFI